MIGEADKDDSGSVDFGERNVFTFRYYLFVCQRNYFNTFAIISIISIEHSGSNLLKVG